MGIPATGAVALSDIETEYGGSAPTALTEYYDNGNAPSSGEIQLAADFYGTSNFDPSAHSFTRTSSGSWSYSVPDGASTMRVEMCGGGGGGGGPGDGIISGTSPGGAGGQSTAQMSGGSYTTASGGGGGTNHGGSSGGIPGTAGPTGGSNPPFNGTPGRSGAGSGNYNCCNGGRPGSPGQYRDSGSQNLPNGTSRSISGSVGGGGSGGGGSEGFGGGGGTAGAVHITFQS